MLKKKKNRYMSKEAYSVLIEEKHEEEDDDVEIIEEDYDIKKKFNVYSKEIDTHYVHIVDKLFIFLESTFYITIIYAIFLVFTIVYDLNVHIKPIWDTICKNAIFIIIVSSVSIIVNFVVLLITIFEKRSLFTRRLFMWIWLALLTPYGLFIPAISTPLKIYIILGTSYVIYLLIWVIPMIIELISYLGFIDRWNLRLNHEYINSFKTFITYVNVSFLLLNGIQYVFAYSISVFLQVNVIPFVVIILSLLLHILEIIDIFNVNYYKTNDQKRSYILTKIYNLTTINLNSLVIILIGLGFFLTNQNFRLSWFGVVPAKKFKGRSNKNTESRELIEK
jgi:hypothetical protein